MPWYTSTVYHFHPPLYDLLALCDRSPLQEAGTRNVSAFLKTYDELSEAELAAATVMGYNWELWLDEREAAIDEIDSQIAEEDRVVIGELDVTITDVKVSFLPFGRCCATNDLIQLSISQVFQAGKLVSKMRPYVTVMLGDQKQRTELWLPSSVRLLPNAFTRRLIAPES